MDSIAQIISDVYFGLGQPPIEHLTMEDIARLTKNRLSFRVEVLSQSDQNQILSKTEFNLTVGREYSLAAIGQGVPCWLERKVNLAPYESWVKVPNCNLKDLENSRVQGLSCWSNFTLDGIQKLRVSYDPALDGVSTFHRLYYDSDTIVSFALEDPTKFPPRFNTMIADEVKLDCIAQIMLRMAQLATNDNPVNPVLLQAWELNYERTKERVAEWQKAWEVFAWQSRGDTSGKRDDVIHLRGRRALNFGRGF